MATDPFKKKPTFAEQLQAEKAKEAASSATLAKSGDGNQGLGRGKASGISVTRPKGVLTPEQEAEVLKRQELKAERESFGLRKGIAPGLIDPKTATPAQILQARRAIPGADQAAAVSPLTEQATSETGELQSKIDEPLDLAPDPLLETTAGVGLQTSVKLGNIATFGVAEYIREAMGINPTEEQVDEFSKTGIGKVVGNVLLATEAGIALFGAGAAAAYVAPLVAQSTMGTVVSGSVAKFFGFSALAGLGASATIGKIGTARKVIGGMVEEGERIEADVRNGVDPNFALARLEEMADQLDEAEATIKQVGQYDITYRLSDGHLADEQAIIKAREAIRRRINAVSNIALQGAAALDADALMLNAAARVEANPEFFK